MYGAKKMSSRLEELLEKLIEIGEKQLENSNSLKERESRDISESIKKNEKKEQSSFVKPANSLQRGNALEMGNTAATGIIGKAGLAGAAISTAFAAASLAAPRGYNAFNIFEKFDKTRVKPFQQVSDIAYEYGRYGKSLSDEQIMKLYSGGVAAEERGFKEVERVRKMISTGITKPILSKMGLGFMADLAENSIESLASSTRNFISPDMSTPQDKTVNAQLQARKMQKSIARQDKFDDSY